MTERTVSREQLKQALLERYTLEMYERISNGSAAVAGLGGLGSHIALMLTRAGIGELVLVDFDRVELTNLNRQAYNISHLGQPKTKALEKILREINPYLNVKVRNEYVTEEKIEGMFRDCRILCEAFDKPEEKAMLVNTVLERCPETVVVSGVGMAGCGSANTIETKWKMKRLYLCGDGETELDHETCLMSSRVMVCAAHQANMVLRLLLGEAEP
ncbi:MAG: sulfur carrier protein ThiS adenylyltransferase ThiF [Lachnospiraceae bacterium]|nr:sulfur carrier protein ThiS adenylyltransferase ThiF [Lachnospiraceae bacterium]